MRYIGLSEPWSISDALKWRRQHEPNITQEQALADLHKVCASGNIRIVGTRRDANPAWPAKKKIEVRFGRQEETLIPATELRELYFDLNGKFPGGSLSWHSSKSAAWWPVNFASDDLINAWLPIISLGEQGAGDDTAGAAALDPAIAESDQAAANWQPASDGDLSAPPDHLVSPPSGIRTNKAKKAEEAAGRLFARLDELPINERPANKAEALEWARGKVAHIGSISDKGLERAWNLSAPEEWKLPGRPKKITTP